VVQTVRGSELIAADSVADGASPGTFTTSSNHMHYAATTAPMTVAGRARVNAMSVSMELEAGCVSIGILDVAAQRFVASVVVNAPGAAHATLIVDQLPATCQVIVSNHQAVVPGVSRFRVHTVDFRAITLAEPPPGRVRT